MPRSFRLPFQSRARIASEIDEELAFHLKAMAARLEREGWPAVEAILGSMTIPGLLDRYLGASAYEQQMSDTPAPPPGGGHPVRARRGGPRRAGPLRGGGARRRGRA